MYVVGYIAVLLHCSCIVRGVLSESSRPPTGVWVAVGVCYKFWFWWQPSQIHVVTAENINIIVFWFVLKRNTDLNIATKTFKCNGGEHLSAGDEIGLSSSQMYHHQSRRLVRELFFCNEFGTLHCVCLQDWCKSRKHATFRAKRTDKDLTSGLVLYYSSWKY